MELVPDDRAGDVLWDSTELALEIALPSARGSGCRSSHDGYPLGNQTCSAIVLEPLASSSTISS